MMTTTTTTTMEDATVTEPPSSDGSSSISTAFIDRMHHRMNMIHSILQPLGALVEQQEVAIQSDLSVQAAEDDLTTTLLLSLPSLPQSMMVQQEWLTTCLDKKQKTQHHQSSPHHLPTLVAPESEELRLQLVQQHPQARRKRWLPSVAKVPVSRSPGAISSMSLSMMNREKH
jgi:hypothetical protein